MERMTGLDAAFLYLETPAAHMHVSGVMVFDPSTIEGGEYSFEWVVDQVNRRLVPEPEFRRRVMRVPFNLHHPVWVEDPYFDVRNHVKRIGCPAPGGPEELAEVTNEILSLRLDREKPLWEMWVVEDLENGHVALVAKMHHATIDGVTGANMIVHLFDFEANAEPPPLPDLPEPDRIPSELELVTYAVTSRVRSPFRFLRTLRETGETAINIARRRIGGSEGMTAPFTAPRTSFNGGITPRRSTAFVNLPLDEVKEVKAALGATVNDVVLAVCGGALIRYLEENGEQPDKPLTAAIPVSVHEQSDGSGGVNKVSAMFASLATDIEDPVDRVRKINEVSKAAKDEHSAIGANLLQNWGEFTGPNIGLAMRLYSHMNLAERHTPIHNLVISNVPGPPFPLYFGGAKLVSLNPLGPIFDGAGLNVTVLSYLDSIGFGLIACPKSVHDIWRLARHIPDAFDELRKAAASPAADEGAADVAPAGGAGTG